MQFKMKRWVLGASLLVAFTLAACGDATVTSTPGTTAAVATPTNSVTTSVATTTAVATTNPVTTGTTRPTTAASLTPEQAISNEILTQRKLTRSEAKVVVEKIDSGYARVTLTPANPATSPWEGGIIFMKQEGNSWKELAAGSAFMPEQLQALGVPRSLWTPA